MHFINVINHSDTCECALCVLRLYQMFSFFFFLQCFPAWASSERMFLFLTWLHNFALAALISYFFFHNCLYAFVFMFELCSLLLTSAFVFITFRPTDNEFGQPERWKTLWLTSLKNIYFSYRLCRTSANRFRRFATASMAFVVDSSMSNRASAMTKTKFRG